MEKGTWKLGLIGPGRANEVLKSARTVTEAAQKLGVTRRSLQRWLADGKVRRPRPARKPRSTPEAPASVAAASDLPTPVDAWAAGIEAAYELDETERQILGLARESLRLAQSPDIRTADRLAAMRRFCEIVKILNLE